MEYKRIAEVGALKAAESGTAEVVIATIGVVDSDGDVLERGAIGTQTVAILPAHNAGSVPLGKARTRELGDKVLATLRFNLDVPEARSWHAALKFDVEHGPAVQEYSWGYVVPKSRPGMHGGRRVRFLERVALFEVSPVVKGASVGTGTVGVKCTDCEARGGSHDHVDDGLRAAMAAAKVHVDAYESGERAANEYLRKMHAKLQYAEIEAICTKVEHDAIRERLKAQRDRYYTETSHPDPVIERAAKACLSMCAAELGIPVPLMAWMVPETSSERAHAAKHGARDWPHLRSEVPIYGAYQVATGVIWLRADLSFEKTMQYVAHEARHAAGGDEPEAYAYQRVWADRLPRHDNERTN